MFQRPIRCVPTTPDPNKMQKYRDTNGSRIVIQIGGVYTTFCQEEGILLEKYRDRNGRCIASGVDWTLPKLQTITENKIPIFEPQLFHWISHIFPRLSGAFCSRLYAMESVGHTSQGSCSPKGRSKHLLETLLLRAAPNKGNWPFFCKKKALQPQGYCCRQT